MKNSKKLIAVLLCVILGIGACLTGCTTTETQETELDALSAPTNVAVHYGDTAYSSEDDTVSFDAVENAVEYHVYVYADGDEVAKVTTGTATTIELPAPLDAGTYNVSVVAVGDGKNYSNSVGSEAVSYTVEEMPGITKLGTVSNITMDFSNVDADNSKYPTISFDGVKGASKYLVDIYAADKDGNKSLTSLGYTTRFTVPADKTEKFMLDSTNYGDLMPGWFVVSVTAYGDGELYSNGDAVEQFIAWTGVKCEQPTITVTEQENGGLKLELSNYSAYAVGSSLTISVYSDEACTKLVKQTTLTYTTSESFGNITHNNSITLEVKESDGELNVGETYYFVASLNKDIYIGDYASKTVSVTCTKAGTGSSGGGQGGFPGGGGGDASWTLAPEKVTFAEGAETFSWNIGEHEFFHTTATLKSSEDGKYVYSLAKGDPNAPFEIEMTLTLNADGKAVLSVGSGGPITGGTKNGTWTVEDGNITIVW